MLEGIDVYGGSGNPNWRRLKQAGISFAFIKATQGDGYANPLYQQQRNAAQGQGIVVGPYHFYEHSVDPASQAHHFAAVVGSFKGMLQPVVDFERPEDGGGPLVGTDGKPYGRGEALRRLDIFMAKVREACGRYPTIYSYPHAWSSLLGNTGQYTPNCSLWIASYNRQSPQLIGAWRAWTFWQYTDRGVVYPGGPTFDRDRFYADATTLAKFVI